jgi:hypothetical protein
MKELGFIELPIWPVHALAVSLLPAVHTDPFARIMIAQAPLGGSRVRCAGCSRIDVLATNIARVTHMPRKLPDRARVDTAVAAFVRR